MFDFGILSPEDYLLVTGMVDLSQPNLIISPNGNNPYLARWHLHKGNRASIYLHAQVADDPYCDLHDHPSASTSLILSGGYKEFVCNRVGDVWVPLPIPITRRPGDMIYRPAEAPHRLVLPEGSRYSLSLFMMAPGRREWGFWMDGVWANHKDVIKTEDGVSMRL